MILVVESSRNQSDGEMREEERVKFVGRPLALDPLTQTSFLLSGENTVNSISTPASSGFTSSQLHASIHASLVPSFSLLFPQHATTQEANLYFHSLSTTPSTQ